jgi:hypothetical protein
MHDAGAKVWKAAIKMRELNHVHTWNCTIWVNKNVREQQIPGVSTCFREKEMIKTRQLGQKVHKT